MKRDRTVVTDQVTEIEPEDVELEVVRAQGTVQLMKQEERA